MKSYQNGNREITIKNRDEGFVVTQQVWDGTKWQYSSRKIYKTKRAAERAAEAHVAQIPQGWTQFPEWTISGNV